MVIIEQDPLLLLGLSDSVWCSPCSLRVFHHIVDFYLKVHNNRDQTEVSNAEKLGNYEWSTGSSGGVVTNRKQNEKSKFERLLNIRLLFAVHQ